MNTVFSNNLKKLRSQKNFTQEQVAEILGVSTQTVSRWECNTTLPDVLLLPEIARLYCVTVDDLFKANPSAYDNLFQRLAAVYHKTKEPEDFIRADLEFKNMSKSAPPSLEDLRLYALIHQFMMGYCKNKALRLLDEGLEQGKNAPTQTYWLIKYAKANFSVITGDSEKFIHEQRHMVAQNPDQVEELCVLLQAYYYAKRYEEGYDLFAKAKQQFAHFGKLYSVGGDICQKLQKYEEAFECWDTAIRLNNGFFLDAQYSKAYCYEELGEYEKAYAVWLEIIKELRKNGNDIQTEIEEKRAQSCLKKIK